MPTDPNGLNSSLEELNDFVSAAEDEIKLRPDQEETPRIVRTDEKDYDAGPESYAPIVEGIPSHFESQFYRMNRKTVELLANGSQLKNGMIVLIEDYMARVDIERAFAKDLEYRPVDPYALRRAETNNRWCRVSNVAHDKNHQQIVFVGEYADGTKVQRRYSDSYAWYVTIDSLFD